MVKARLIASRPAGIDRHRASLRQFLQVLRLAHRLLLCASVHVALTALPNFASIPFP